MSGSFWLEKKEEWCGGYFYLMTYPGHNTQIYCQTVLCFYFFNVFLILFFWKYNRKVILISACVHTCTLYAKVLVIYVCTSMCVHTLATVHVWRRISSLSSL